MRIPLLRIPSFPRIVISSEARNLLCTPVKRRLWDSDETKNRRFLRFLTNAGRRYLVKIPRLRFR